MICSKEDRLRDIHKLPSLDSEEWVYVKEGSCSDIQKAMKSPALKEYAREIAKSAVKYQGNAPK